MALIRRFNWKDRERRSLHDEIEAEYSAFDLRGRQILQIDTYGRPSREMPGKQSQTIQLDKDSAHALFKILKEEFHF